MRRPIYSLRKMWIHRLGPALQKGSIAAMRNRRRVGGCSSLFVGIKLITGRACPRRSSSSLPNVPGPLVVPMIGPAVHFSRIDRLREYGENPYGARHARGPGDVVCEPRGAGRPLERERARARHRPTRPTRTSRMDRGAGSLAGGTGRDEQLYLPLRQYLSAMGLSSRGRLLGAPCAGWLDAESATSRPCHLRPVVRRRAWRRVSGPHVPRRWPGAAWTVSSLRDRDDRPERLRYLCPFGRMSLNRSAAQRAADAVACERAR